MANLSDNQPGGTELTVKQLWSKAQDITSRLKAMEMFNDSNYTMQQVVDEIQKRARTAFNYTFPVALDDQYNVKLKGGNGVVSFIDKDNFPHVVEINHGLIMSWKINGIEQLIRRG